MPAVCNNVSWALWGSQGPCCKGNLVSERNIHIIYLQGKAEWKHHGTKCMVYRGGEEITSSWDSEKDPWGGWPLNCSEGKQNFDGIWKSGR